MRFRSIALFLLIAAGSIVFFMLTQWLRSPSVHFAGPAETKAIQAALAQYSTKYGRNPGAGRTIKAIKLEGQGWIVQITERANPNPGAFREINTFHVSGDLSCQWLSIDAWGAY